MKDTIVTAIYYHTPQSRIGGRGYIFHHYRAPFKNLLNLGANIVVYSHESQKEQIEVFFEENNFKDYKVVDYDLDQYTHSAEIYRLKEESGLIDKNGLANGFSEIANDRNYHLCLSKVEFLQQAIEQRYFESSNYYWIDAGLFHHGIVPERFGGIERYTIPREENYWPLLETSICTPDFFPQLRAKTNNSALTLIGIDGYYAATRWWSEVSEASKLTHIIGGLVGGQESAVLELALLFKQRTELLFSKNILSLEEEILSILYSEYYSEIPYLGFKTWYHDIPEERNYFGIEPGADSFYKIFLK